MECLESNFVAVLEFAILAGFLLNGIVGEMDVFVGAVLEAKLEAGCAHVACGIEVCGNKGSGCNQYKTSDVEFPPVEQVRGDVFLHDECSLGMLQLLSFNVLLNVLNSLTYLYPTASIRVLSWLHNP